MTLSRQSQKSTSFSAGGFDAPRFQANAAVRRQFTEATPLTPDPGFGAPQSSPTPTAAERSILACVFVASVLFAASVNVLATTFASSSPAAPEYPLYREWKQPESVICQLRKTECVPMSLYVDDSRPHVETLVAEASFPQHMRSDLRFRQDENGNLILRVRGEGGFGAWCDARLSDLAPPQSDYNASKKRAYSGTWRAGTNYRSRLIEELAASERKTVSAYDRPKHPHLMQPLRANFLITTALPTLTDAPLLDLMELPADYMDRAQAIFVRNYRIRQGQANL